MVSAIDFRNIIRPSCWNFRWWVLIQVRRWWWWERGWRWGWAWQAVLDVTRKLALRLSLKARGILVRTSSMLPLVITRLIPVGHVFVHTLIVFIRHDSWTRSNWLLWLNVQIRLQLGCAIVVHWHGRTVSVVRCGVLIVLSTLLLQVDLPDASWLPCYIAALVLYLALQCSHGCHCTTRLMSSSCHLLLTIILALLVVCSCRCYPMLQSSAARVCMLPLATHRRWAMASSSWQATGGQRGSISMVLLLAQHGHLGRWQAVLHLSWIRTMAVLTRAGQQADWALLVFSPSPAVTSAVAPRWQSFVVAGRAECFP